MDYYLLGKLPVIEPAEDSPNAIKPAIKRNLNTQSTNANTTINSNTIISTTSPPVINAPEDHYD